MKLYKTQESIVIEKDGQCYLSKISDWDDLVNQDDLYGFLKNEVTSLSPVGGQEWLEKQTILAPIQSQEIWAAGVTYLRSRNARMEESQESGGDTFL